MSDWSQGYVTDVHYTYGFYKEMAPQAMRFALHAAGFESPPAEGCNYCELAFGQGAGLALLAAANPGSRFWGNDFNPAHVAGARKLADEAGLANIDLSDASFAEMLERDLPEFDWITMHGVWSWVGRENQAHITEFVRRKLKVGGVLYVSYNAMPGWAPLHPLREVLYRACEPGAVAGQTTVERVDGALRLAERLAQVPGSYLQRTPQVHERLAALAKADRGYIAHEYLNRHWETMYFADMAERLSAAKLSWAAHANPLHNLDAMCVNPQLQQLLDEIGDPVLREALRDIGMGTAFRRDLFVRGARRVAGAAQVDLLMGRDYVLQQPREQCSMKASTPVGTCTLDAPTYEPLLDRIARGRTPARELAGIGDFGGVEGTTRLLRALIVMVGLGYIAPCASTAASGQAQASAKRFNERQLQSALSGAPGDFQWLASAATGGGIVQSRVEQITAAMHRDHGAGAPAAIPAVVDAMFARGVVPLKDGEPIGNRDLARAELTARVQTWASQQRPLFVAHGIDGFAGATSAT